MRAIVVRSSALDAQQVGWLRSDNRRIARAWRLTVTATARVFLGQIVRRGLTMVVVR